jgi:putative restriction endonuclease
LDAVFDRGFISFSDEGNIIISSKISTEAQELLGFGSGLKLKTVMDEHKVYLNYHRNQFLQ